MKKIRKLLSLILVLYAICYQASWAMLPGPDVIIECPADSDTLLKKTTLTSGNTFGGRRWSDGYGIFPMLPSSPQITRCGPERSFFWVAEAKVVGRIEIWNQDQNVPEEWNQAPYIQSLTEAEYLEAIEKGMGNTKEKERFLRLQAWWSANNPLRGRNNQPTNVSQSPFLPGSKARQNLEQLVQMFDTSAPIDRLMRAEALRELGWFHEALRTLQAPFPKGLTEEADWLRELVKSRDVLVREKEIKK